MTDRSTRRDLGTDLAVRLLQLDYDAFAPILMPRGSARQRHWTAEDGWSIVYTTERVEGGGKRAGKFVTMAYRPFGPGARNGQFTEDTEWRLVYERVFATRKAAKARAIALYRQHSPKWDARHPAAAEDPEVEQ